MTEPGGALKAYVRAFAERLGSAAARRRRPWQRVVVVVARAGRGSRASALDEEAAAVAAMREGMRLQRAARAAATGMADDPGADRIGPARAATTERRPLAGYGEDFGRRLADATAGGHDPRTGPQRAMDVLQRPLSARALAAGLTGRLAALRRRVPARLFAIAAVTLVCGAGAAAAAIHFLAQPHYDVGRYLGHGDAFDCVDIPSQAYAQAVLRADPSDPDKLDDDGDGIACPGLTGPRDLKPVQAIAARFACKRSDPRSARCSQPSRHFDPNYFLRFGAAGFYDCKAFARQADAQAVLRLAPQDPNHLDRDGDGIACPRLPGPKDLVPVPRGPSNSNGGD